MECKYCNDLTDEQFETCRTNAHKRIHWLIIYKEQSYPHLNEYFETVLYKLSGLNSLLNYPKDMMELLCLIESARLENLKGDKCNYKLYRKTVLDAHSELDKVFDECKNNTKRG